MPAVTCKEIIDRLTESVQRNRADAILLSGGLDSSILASIAKPRYAVTAAFGSDAPDIPFSRTIANRYCRRHVQVILDEKRLVEIMENVIKIFKTFDPMEIRNSSVAYAGIESAKLDGYTHVMTGDGGDELFAGYNYLQRYHSDLARLAKELERLWEVMHFSSMQIGENLGVGIKSPFLDGEFLEYSKKIPVQEKVGEYQGQKWGKFLLRNCFEKELGHEIVWRKKLAQEEGSSVDRIQQFIEKKVIGDADFKNGVQGAASEGVKIRSKEHLYYYLVFKKNFQIPGQEECELRCPECRGCFKGLGRFCRICGAFPVTPVTQQ